MIDNSWYTQELPDQVTLSFSKQIFDKQLEHHFYVFLILHRFVPRWDAEDYANYQTQLVAVENQNEELFVGQK